MGKPSAEETKNPSWKEIYYALSNSPRPHSENGRLDSLSKSDAAKLQKTSSNLQAMLQEMSVQRYDNDIIAKSLSDRASKSNYRK